MCNFCKSNKLMRVLAVRETKGRTADSQGFILGMDMTDMERPKLKTFFWGVKDDPDLGNALTIDISYCPMCGRKLKP